MDGFAAKLDSSGGLVWNTFMGSSNADNSTSIAVDSAGNVYVAGIALPAGVEPQRLTHLQGSRMPFAAKLDGGGTSMEHLHGVVFTG